jgi:ribosomal protein L34
VLALTTADPSGFRAWTSTETGRDMIEIHREKAWQEFLYELRTKATIRDERWKYFNY